jgi:hypothetical protein
MTANHVTPREEARLEEKREDRRAQQPYANELDDRELEHAHKDRRPVNPHGATTLATPPRNARES